MANSTRPTHARLRTWLVGGPRTKVRHLVNGRGDGEPLCGMSTPKGLMLVDLDQLILAAAEGHVPEGIANATARLGAELPICTRCEIRAADTAEATFGVSVRRWRK
jgi:hypothetical protein